MKVNEYVVIKRNYGIPELKLKQCYNVTSYNGEHDIEKLSYMIDEIYELSYLNEEYLYVVSMDTNFHIKGIYEAGHGYFKGVQVYSKELFTFLLLTGAERFVVFHNHPNGMLEASDGDKKWTMSMNMCANILNIEMLDHLIMTEEGFTSIKDEINLFEMDKIEWDKINI